MGHSVSCIQNRNRKNIYLFFIVWTLSLQKQTFTRQHTRRRIWHIALKWRHIEPDTVVTTMANSLINFTRTEWRKKNEIHGATQWNKMTCIEIKTSSYISFVSLIMYPLVKQRIHLTEWGLWHWPTKIQIFIEMAYFYALFIHIIFMADRRGSNWNDAMTHQPILRRRENRWCYIIFIGFVVGIFWCHNLLRHLISVDCSETCTHCPTKSHCCDKNVLI